jgi:NADPH:quinone reductase-like Zn-dependent oxidoreductase
MAVTDAGGSVGSAAVLLGKHLGATVISIASSDARCARIAENGTDHTINYRNRDLTATLQDVTDGKGVDLVSDVAGGETLMAAIQGLVWFGLVWFGLVWFGLVWFGLVWFGLVWFGLVWFGLDGANAGEVVPVDIVDLFHQHLTIYGCGCYTRRILEAVFAARVEGLAAPPIDTVFPLAKAADAHRLMESCGFLAESC